MVHRVGLHAACLCCASGDLLDIQSTHAERSQRSNSKPMAQPLDPILHLLCERRCIPEQSLSHPVKLAFLLGLNRFQISPPNMRHESCANGTVRR